MKMEGESSALKRNLIEWSFSQYPKYILLPIAEHNDQSIKLSISNVVYSEVNLILNVYLSDIWSC